MQPAPAPAKAAGCTRHTARCPDARLYTYDLGPCCLGHIIEVVRDVAAMLTDMGIEWWADYGTLLGAVRGGGIIRHDKDADLGMRFPGKPAMRAMEAQMKRQGHDATIRRDGDNLKVSLSQQNRTSVDVFAWHEKPPVMYRSRYITSVDRFKGRDFRTEDAFPLTTVEWEGMTLPAPKNPAAFCAFRYGPNWQIPIRRNNDGVRRGESR